MQGFWTGSRSPQGSSEFSGASRFFFVATTFTAGVFLANLSFGAGLAGFTFFVPGLIPAMAPLLGGIPACIIISIFSPKQALRLLAIVGVLFVIGFIAALAALLIVSPKKYSEGSDRVFLVYLGVGVTAAVILHFRRFWSLGDFWRLAKCELVALLALPFAFWLLDLFGWLGLLAVLEWNLFHNLLRPCSLSSAIWVSVILILVCRRFQESNRKRDRFWLILWTIVALPWWFLFWGWVGGTLVTSRLPTRPLPRTGEWVAIERGVLDILAEKCRKFPTSISTFDELDVDDLDKIELRMLLEEKFSVELKNNESIESVPDAVLAIYNGSLPKGAKPWRDYWFKDWIGIFVLINLVSLGSLACWTLEKIIAGFLPRRTQFV